MTTNPLAGLATARRNGSPYGITSICSAHPLVIQTAIRRAVRDKESSLLIEATCNQVNQFGGYTGMTPDLFIAFVHEIASKEGLDPQRIIFGGDHLGPNPWRTEPAAQAMSKAEAMVTAYVWAGFSKIHLDASMGCAGEPAALDDETIATRAARLAKAAEKAVRATGGALPVYIIGTEVPAPGGVDHAINDLKPTEPVAARRTIEVHREIFAREGLSEAFGRVIAVVVQPGVEFGSQNVIAYRPEASKPLTGLLDEEPSLVYEAHSTDYQSRAALTALVGNGFPILKVGPGLTFGAARGALRARPDRVRNDRGLWRQVACAHDGTRDVGCSRPLAWPLSRHGSRSLSAAALQLQRPYPLLLEQPNGQALPSAACVRRLPALPFPKR